MHAEEIIIVVVLPDDLVGHRHEGRSKCHGWS
jgi:hypothetical protein